MEGVPDAAARLLCVCVFRAGGLSGSVYLVSCAAERERVARENSVFGFAALGTRWEYNKRGAFYNVSSPERGLPPLETRVTLVFTDVGYALRPFQLLFTLLPCTGQKLTL